MVLLFSSEFITAVCNIIHGNMVLFICLLLFTREWLKLFTSISCTVSALIPIVCECLAGQLALLQVED